MPETDQQQLAILGMACRFPDAATPDEYWEILANAVECSSEVPADRWPVQQFYEAEPGRPGKSISRWGSFVDEPYGFDPEFFGLANEQGRSMDPQHRILLELSCECLADAGLERHELAGRSVGVFVGIAQSSYEEAATSHLVSERASSATILTENLRNMAAGQIAQFLDFRGPALAIDTACSSALVALHYARQSIVNGDCDYALVGAVNLNLTATPFLAFSAARAISPEPRCYFFDERAQGILLGEGAGMILVCSAFAARARKDRIHGVVKAMAVTNDGRSHSPMAPNPAGQQRAIERAYSGSNVSMDDITFIEAHGTGTSIGDASEARALKRAFAGRSDKPQIYVGSVKPNIGHTLAASGIAGLMKVLLLLRHRVIPPTLNSGQPRSRLRLDEAGLCVNQSSVMWPENRPLVAGLNSFGFGGTNVHAVIAGPEPGDRSPLPLPKFSRTALRLETDGDVSAAPAVTAGWLHQTSWERVDERVPEPRAEIVFDKNVSAILLEPTGTFQSLTPEELSNCPPEAVLVFDGRKSDMATATLLWRYATSLANLRETVSARLPSRLVVLTRDAVRLIGTGTVPQPMAAAIATLTWALSDELFIPCQVVDHSGVSFDGKGFAAACLSDLRGHVLWRDGAAWRRRLSVCSTTTVSLRRLSHDGVYIITGGATGVGAALAKGLALDEAPTLVLVGRTRLCDDLRRADLVQKLRWAGATVDYYEADVGSPEDVDCLLDFVLQRYGKINGIIHAAGVVQAGSLSSKPVSAFESTFRAKAAGSENLHSAVRSRGLEIDFYVNISSISSIIPGLAGGLSDYAAANAYMDAHAIRYGYQTINWTVWAESGRAAETGLVDKMSALGLSGISDTQGYEHFRAALGWPESTLVVVDPVAVTRFKMVGSLASQHDDSSAPRAPDRMSVRTADHQVTQTLIELLANDLKVSPDQIDAHVPFAQLGLDSIAAIDLVLKLEGAGFGELPPTLFFEHNTIAKLSRHLAGQKGDTLPSLDLFERAPPREAYPLSAVQRALLSQELQSSSGSAFVYLQQTVTGELDAARIEAALQQLVETHPMLTARFQFDESGASQSMSSEPSVVLERISDASNWEDPLVNAPMAPTRDRLFRALLIEHEPGRFSFCLLAHHLVADGWSLSVLAQEFWACYSGRSLVPPRTGFHEYVALLNDETSSDCAVSFWRNADGHPRQEWVRCSTPETSEPQYLALPLSLGNSLSQRLEQRAARQGVTLFHWLLACYLRCLKNWLSSSVLTLGVAEARRGYPLAELGRVVGPLADVFPVHFALEDPNEPISQLARRVRDCWLQVHRYTKVSRQTVHQSGNAAPASFSFSRFPVTQPDGLDLTVSDVWARTATPQTQLSLLCWEFEKGLQFSWNYRGDLFSRARVATFSRDFESTVKESLIEEATPFTFLKQIAKRLGGDGNAIVGDAPLSYSDLAGQLGGVCQQFGGYVGPGDVVAYVGEPGAEAILALLATFWLGGTWLPIDPAMPDERVRRQLATANARLLVNAGTVTNQAQIPTVTIAEIPTDAATGEIHEWRPDDIAYIIFTSGSTGVPNGVPITFDALDRYLAWSLSLGYSSDDVVMAATTLSFDASLRQMLAPLMTGGAVLPLQKRQLVDPAELLDELVHHGVTVWSSAPSLWEQLLVALEAGSERSLALRQVQLGGETLPASFVRRWYSSMGRDVEFVNLYGPTETTINASAFRLTHEPDPAWVTVPIGTAIGPTNLMIDQQSGELLIGGPLLTAGYLQDRQLTDSRFVHRDTRRYFRSGDLVEELADGNLVFKGRLDNQVKRRGFRIELEDIEAALVSEPSISRAVTSYDPKTEAITAHLLVRGIAPTLDGLRSFLAERLPPYMIPTAYEVHTEFPTLTSGKTDRAGVLSGVGEQLNRVAVCSHAEAVCPELATIWKELLGIDEVEAGDDFFLLGGDSLAVLELAMRLRALGYPIASAAELYELKTLSQQSELLETVARVESSSSLPRDVADSFPLSRAQAGFVLARRIDATSHSTSRVSLWLEGSIDQRALSEAIQYVVGGTRCCALFFWKLRDLRSSVLYKTYQPCRSMST